MLQEPIDWIFYSLLGFDKTSQLAQAANFFVYDSIKILLLLFFMITAIGFLRSYISPSQIKRWLGGRREGIANLVASLFGALTPFCSCSSIPLFMGFLKSGVPLGVTFSFLVTSPIINEYLVVLMLGFFGWKITAAYVISGILIGTFTGIILGRMGVEKYIKKEFRASGSNLKEVKYTRLSQRIQFGISESWCILKRLWLWILVGVGIGTIIHNFIPQETIQAVVNSTGIFAVPLAVLIGVPLYGSCAAIVPIAVALFEKGVPIGTALSFMMAVSALSLPEAVILKRVMKIKLLALFFGIVTVAIIITGYIFNFLEVFLV
jgi:uncharacterized membrane protein YraQ (UPF0718 family)